MLCTEVTTGWELVDLHADRMDVAEWATRAAGALRHVKTETTMKIANICYSFDFETVVSVDGLEPSFGLVIYKPNPKPTGGWTASLMIGKRTDVLSRTERLPSGTRAMELVAAHLGVDMDV